jgi:hypothetical protein
MSVLRHKCIPMLACNLFRIFDLIKREQEIFRLIVFLSDSRKQQLYSVNKNKNKIIFFVNFFCFSYFLKKLLIQYFH